MARRFTLAARPFVGSRTDDEPGGELFCTFPGNAPQAPPGSLQVLAAPVHCVSPGAATATRPYNREN